MRMSEPRTAVAAALLSSFGCENAAVHGKAAMLAAEFSKRIWRAAVTPKPLSSRPFADRIPMREKLRHSMVPFRPGSNGHRNELSP